VAQTASQAAVYAKGLNWINVRRSQKNGMIFFIQNVFFTLGNMIDYFQV
jgi:hypothetical protein